MIELKTKSSLLLIVIGLAAGCRAAPRAETPSGSSGAVCDAEWSDRARNRTVPVRIRMPQGNGRVPVVLFSHGLGGSLAAGTKWGEAWAAAGIGVVHLQHPGSDTNVLRGGGLRAAMSGAQLVARAGDVSFVLGHIETTPREGACNLKRLDVTRAGMSGHSFGAHTTQAVAGQVFPGARTLRDPRIRAAIAFSPAPPQASDDLIRRAFAEIDIPFLSLTGTRDEVPALTGVTPEQRTLPYRYMPAGDKYLVVFEGADHAAFSGQNRRGSSPRSDRAITEITTTFWRATLLGDLRARAWLRTTEPRALLEQGDRWEGK